MQQFLKETWELWYWAMFCPAKLQARMNAWDFPQGKGWTQAQYTVLIAVYY